MFKPLAILMGVAMLSLGASAASAQAGRAPEVRVGERSGRDNGRGVGQDRVWVEDFAMVEERYKEAGHYENRERKVWVAEQRVTVTERVYVAETRVMVTQRVLVPESKYTVEEQVYVAGQNVTIREAHTMRNGSIHYIDRVQWAPAHYECRQVEKCRPAHYENVQVEKCVPAHYENRDVVKCVPAHYETVCEKVFVEGCMKTRMVRKCIGGHWEVKVCR
jgi:hypothetical protein